MTDLKKDEPIIELTEVVEEAPGPSEGRWMETTPPPSREGKIAEPPGAAPGENSGKSEDLKGIPDSPLKKFLLAEEEFLPSDPPPRPAGPPAVPPPDFQTLRPAPGSNHLIPEALRRFPLNPEEEMRSLRESMLARAEEWMAKEGRAILERVAREMFPKIAEEILRKEIEKLKSEAEEKE